MCINCLATVMGTAEVPEPLNELMLICVRCGDDVPFPPQVDDCGNMYCDDCRTRVDESGRERRVPICGHTDPFLAAEQGCGQCDDAVTAMLRDSLKH